LHFNVRLEKETKNCSLVSLLNYILTQASNV
jgi:hypothetical protein